ncbi:hypothetical protein [Pseudomonas sp. S2_E01]
METNVLGTLPPPSAAHATESRGTSPPLLGALALHPSELASQLPPDLQSKRFAASLRQMGAAAAREFEAIDLGHIDAQVAQDIEDFVRNGQRSGGSDLESVFVQAQRLTTEQTPVGRMNALFEAAKDLLAAAKGPALNLAHVAGRTGLIVGLTKMLNYVVRDYVDDAMKMGNTPDAVKAWWVSALAMIGPALILVGAVRNGLNGTGSVSSNLWRVLTASLTVGALIASRLTGMDSKTLPAMVGATLYSVLRDLLNTLFPLKDNAAAPSGMNTGATAVIYGVSQYILAQVGQLIPTVNGSGLMPNLIRTSLDSFGLVLDDVVYMLCRSCDWLTGASMPEPPVAGYEQERDRTLKVLASAQVPDRHQCANTAFNIGGQRMAVAHAFTLILPAMFSILQTSEVEDPQGLLNLFIGFMSAAIYLPLVFGALMRTDRSYTLSETPTA